MSTIVLSHDILMERLLRVALSVTGLTIVAIASIGLLSSLGSAMPPRNNPQMPIVVASPFIYSFNSSGVLNETSSMGNSTSPYWWISAGGRLIIEGNSGETMQGDAPLLDQWRVAYALSNSQDTDGGAHPQNIFRLVSKTEWENAEVSVQFLVAKDNFSSSPNRNQSNGILLSSRHTGDGRTMYYGGIRVDGTAVIKKKINGVYYTMAQKKVFPGTYARSSTQNGNLLPHDEWIGLKSKTVTNANGSVTITLSMQRAGVWQTLLQTTDAGGASVGYTAPITGAHYVGIRTDFMDVQFDNFRVQ